MTIIIETQRFEDITQKSRALRKYEADFSPSVRGDVDPQMEICLPFGPVIARTTVESALLNRINTFADRHTAPESNEFLVPPNVAGAGGDASLIAVIEDRISQYVLAAEGAVPQRIEIDRIWIVNQFGGTPSPVHFHSGDLSGVLYLMAPEPPQAADLQRTYISGRQAGYLNFLLGGKQRFSKTVLSVLPDPGVFYLFPGWLLHGVEPFRGSGVRRSLSFNACVS